MKRSVRIAPQVALRVLVAVAALSMGTLAGEVGPAGADGPTVVVTPDRVHDGQEVGVDISGFGAGYGSLLECAAAATVDPTFATLDAGCHMLAGPYVGTVPPAHEDVTVAASFEVFNASRTVDCVTEPGGCAVGVIIADLPLPERPITSAFAPVTFLPPPTVGLSPSSDLLDGQSMTLTGENLQPGGTYRVQHCRSSTCDPGRTVGAAADGTLSAAVPALQRFTAGGRPVVCRAACSVLVTPAGGGGPIGRLPYAMAAGSVAVDPHTGLADGHDVQVTGRALMAGYTGPPILGFPTGQWSITQCDGAVLAGPSLGTVLMHCAAAPTTRAVDVPGSTSGTTLSVPARITRILGGTTDCTRGPGACVAGLVRLEQDGSFSAHLVPITFGPAG
jgi:hypothetical protein